MRTRKLSEEDARLREMLRRGDPAGDGCDPAPGEIAAWRRAMLEAVPRRVAWWLPARLAGALAVVVVALVVGIPVWRAMRGPEPLDVAAVPGSAAAPEVAVPSEGPDSRISPPTRGDRAPSTSRQVSPGPPDEEIPALADSGSGAPAQEPSPLRLAAARPQRTTPRERRTIHFTSTRGTRIVWTINPELEL